MKTHAAAVLNAAEYDKRRGGKTMPPDVEAVWPEWKRRRSLPEKVTAVTQLGNKSVTNDVSRNDPRPIMIAGKPYDRRLCRQVYADHSQGNADQNALAQQYTLSKMVIHSIILKGEWGKL